MTALLFFRGILYVAPYLNLDVSMVMILSSDGLRSVITVTNLSLSVGSY